MTGVQAAVRDGLAPQRPAHAPQIDAHVDCWLPDAGAPPLFVEAQSDALRTMEGSLDWVRRNRDLLAALLVDFGALVLRGFAFATAEDFDRFTALYPQYGGGYVAGASPRSAVVGNVMEATRLDARFTIWMHQEMAYLENYPSQIAFFARQVADAGGATIIADMREFTRRLPAHIRDAMETHGVRGVRNYGPAGKSGAVAQHLDDKPWNEGLGTDDKAEAERICAAKGIEPIWNADGSLTMVTTTGAFTSHPVTGERIYRSLLHTHYRTYADFGVDNPGWDAVRARQAFHTGYTLGNGEALSREDSRTIEDLIDGLIVRWEWRNGDILLVDNLQIAHGRDPFTGPRETLVSLMA